MYSSVTLRKREGGGNAQAVFGQLRSARAPEHKARQPKQSYA